jgi:hypothetical protein
VSPAGPAAELSRSTAGEPVVVDEAQFAALRAAVARSAASFHAACLATAPRESLYGLVLLTDNDAQSCSFAAQSEEAFQGSAARHPDTAERWDVAAWEYTDHGRNPAQKALNAVWSGRDDAVHGRAWDDIHLRVFEAFTGGLEDFVGSGAAAVNGQRGRLVTFVFIGDADADMGPRLRAWARRLNPEATDLWFHRPGG